MHSELGNANSDFNLKLHLDLIHTCMVYHLATYNLPN